MTSNDPQTLAAIVGAPSTPQTNEYLKHLTTLPLSDLLAEPTALQTQAHYLTSSLVTLANTSYPTFLEVHQSTTALNTSLSSLSTSLDALVTDSLPALEECASGWKNRTDSVLKERKRARVVLEQHEKLRDLLDIPLLIDTCVRNGYFGEALALAAHARSLGKAFGLGNAKDDLAPEATSAASSSSPPLIIASILAEVDQSITQMLASLLATLHEPHRKLPALWKAVNFLRRMGVFGSRTEISSIMAQSHGSTLRTNGTHVIDAKFSTSDEDTQEAIETEMQIALAFLSGREACLVASLDGCGRDIQGVIRALQGGKTRSTDDIADDAQQLEERELEDIARYLKKYIDAWREGVYDVITQYNTIFLERSPYQTSGNPANTNSSPRITASLQLRQRLHASLHSLLATYASHALTKHLLPTLSSASSLLALPSLPSLLTQLTYCASAFGRVGLDFRVLLTGTIGDAVVAAVAREIRTATTKWAQEISKSYFAEENDAADGNKGKSTTITALSIEMSRSTSSSSKSGPRVERLPSKWLVSANHVNSPPMPDASSTPVLMPPPILASYPPLAVLTNAILTTLNGLRLLAPIHVRDRLIVILENELVKVAQAFLRYAHVVRSEGSGDGRMAGKELSEIEREKEARIVKAFGQVYFGCFVPFVRRALVEGVYSGKVDEVYSRRMGSERDETEEGEISQVEREVGKKMEEIRSEWDGWYATSNDGAS